jgi:diketogulonate reductase-like aldo/keto reductase
LSYFDLFVIEHSPYVEQNALKIWKSLEDAYLSKTIRNIGLSGFSLSQMECLLSSTVIKPFAIQIKFNPFSINPEVIKFCQNHDLLLIAMSPLDHQTSKDKLLSCSIISDIARNHNVSPTQTLLAWAIQSQTLPVVQTLNTDHIKENIMLSNLKLSEREMMEINRLSEVSQR